MNFNQRHIFIECDEYLQNRRKHFSAYLMDKSAGLPNVTTALKYIFEVYLRWKPKEIRDKLNPDIIAFLKLSVLVNRIPCPPELDRNKDFEFVAWHLYPETKNSNDRELTIKLYQKILAGEVSRYPRGFFDGGPLGWYRARAIFQYMLQEFQQFSSLEDMYAYFSRGEAKTVLAKYKLSVPLRELYNSPLDYLHDSLSKYQKDGELYEKYKAKVEKRRRRK